MKTEYIGSFIPINNGYVKVIKPDENTDEQINVCHQIQMIIIDIITKYNTIVRG